MRHLSLIFFLCLLAGPGSAQHSVKLTIEEKPTKWLESEIKDFNGTVLVASDKITYAEIDSVKKILYVVVSNDKNRKSVGIVYLMAYGMDSGEVLWIREFLSDQKLLRIDTLTALTGKGTMVLNPTDGKEIWTSPADLLYYSKKYDIALGYDFGAKKLVGIEVLSGNIAWYDFINQYSLNSLRFLGDTGIVLMGENLQHYSLEKGKGYNTESKVRSNLNTNDTTPLAAVRLALMANRLANQKTYNSEYALGYLMGNLIIRNGGIYLVSGITVYGLSMSGDLRWQTILSKSITGNSKIFYHNDRVYVVKYGLVTFEGEAYYGEVHLGIVDPDTGNEIKTSNLNQTDKTFIKDFLLTDSSIVVAMNNRLVEVALDDLRILNDRSFGNPRMSVGFRNLLMPPYFVLTNDTLENKSVKNPKRIFVENNNDLKIELSEEYEPLDVIPKSRFFYLGKKSDDYTLLHNDTRVLITNDSLQMYPIRFSHNMIRTGGYFCDRDENRIIIVPEKSVIEFLQMPN